jgi:phosphoenolpyruvate carboxykinase (ATP)
MPRHPSVYAELLGERIKRHGSQCWLVNTGWSGGTYGVGKRMPIAYTRALLRAALDGRLGEMPVRKESNFGLLVPEGCPEVPSEVLDPRSTWSDKEAYDHTARELTHRFEENFREFEPFVSDEVKSAGVHPAA